MKNTMKSEKSHVDKDDSLKQGPTDKSHFDNEDRMGAQIATPSEKDLEAN